MEGSRHKGLIMYTPAYIGRTKCLFPAHVHPQFILSPCHLQTCCQYASPKSQSESPSSAFEIGLAHGIEVSGSWKEFQSACFPKEKRAAQIEMINIPLVRDSILKIGHTGAPAWECFACVSGRTLSAGRGFRCAGRGFRCVSRCFRCASR